MKSLKQLIIGTVLGAVVILGVAATTPNEPQKWEYIDITVLKEEKREAVVKVISAHPHGTPKAPPTNSISDLLNFYGSQGWELVSMEISLPTALGNVMGRDKIIFKRTLR